MKKLALIVFVFLNASPVLAAATRNILLIGFWPPSNEMLREFSPLRNHNLGRWQGQNWRNLGYDVYAYFPEFRAPRSGQVGEGSFQVDFASAYNDFMRVTKFLKPIAILGFGMGKGPWELEVNYPNFFYDWFLKDAIPSTIGVKTKYAIPETLKQNIERKSSLPNLEIMSQVNAANIRGAHAYQNEADSPGDYLCGFLSYLIAWYHDEHSNASDAIKNEAGGFIHVNTDSVESAQKALEISLQITIESFKP
jgi:hypothetical protein